MLFDHKRERIIKFIVINNPKPKLTLALTFSNPNPKLTLTLALTALYLLYHRYLYSWMSLFYHNRKRIIKFIAIKNPNPKLTLALTFPSPNPKLTITLALTTLYLLYHR